MATKKTEETKTEKKVAAAKKPAAVKKTAAVKKPAAEKKTVAKKPAAKKTELIIQSPMGGNITPEEILSRIGQADKVYVRVDENKAYWVSGTETGSVDLW